MPPDKVEAMYAGIFKDLAKTQYDHSEFRNPTVCVLTPNSAIVSGEFHRINKDGSLLMEASASYLYARTPDGWKIIANLGLPKKKLVTCD
jgi:hypothetical protein